MEGLGAVAALVGVAVVDEMGGEVVRGNVFLDVCEAFQQARVEGGAGFDFERVDLASVEGEEVDFVFVGVAIKVKVGDAAAVPLRFEAFEDDEVFKNGADEGVAGDLVGLADAEEVAEEADIGEVVFRTFDDAFSEVFEVGRELEDEEGGFEDGEPVADGFGGDADIVGEGAVVEELSGAAGEELEEFLEEGGVFQVNQLANIAFHIGLVVV